MLKFFLLTFLLLGLSVSGEMNEDTEVATLAADVNLNEKAASQEMSQDSSEESSEEDEDEEDDDSGAVEELVSDNDEEEFDQNDDFGSSVLDESEEQEDAAGGKKRRRGWRFRCKGYRTTRSRFYMRRRACHRCMRGHRCRRVCGAYHRARRANARRCMLRSRRAYRLWNIKLRRNWRKIAVFNRKIARHRYAIRYIRRRIRRRRGRFLFRKMRFHRRRWHYWARRNGRNWRARRSLRMRLARNWRRMRYWRRKPRSALRTRKLRILTQRRSRMRGALRRLRIGARKIRAKIRFHRRKYYIYRRRLYYNKKIHAHLRAIRALYRQRSRFLRIRRRLWHQRRMAGIRARRGCARRISHLWRRCRLCKGYCGHKCFRMHMAYARMIAAAHRCSITRMYCHRRFAYRRYARRYGISCRRCRKRTHKRVRKLVCAGTCGAAYKFRLLSAMYGKRCR